MEKNVKYIYILKTGETFENTKKKLGDFDTWIIHFAKETTFSLKVIDVYKNDELPAFDTAAAFIITGSHAMVSQELEWSLKLEKYIQDIKTNNIALLGICYGHQLITKALGGTSDFNKNGVEIGRVRIKNTKNALNDPLFKDFPRQFHAFETHYQSAVKLPANAVVLASTHKEKHQAVRYSSRIWGVQFHPEFNKEIMKEYILNQEEGLKKLGFDTKQLIKKASSTDMSNKILNNFIALIK